MAKTNPLLPVVRSQFEADPRAGARILGAMDEADAVEALKALPATLTAQVFPHLPVDQCAAFLQGIPVDLVRRIAEKLEPQQGASILLALPEEARVHLLQSMSEDVKKEIGDLLNFPQDSVGRLMQTDFIAFRAETRVRAAVEKLRSKFRQRIPVMYGYVVDENNKLTGVLNMRDLLLANPSDALETVMRKDLLTVDGFMEAAVAARLLSAKGYLAAPVVDGQGVLLGVVRAEQLGKPMQALADDIQKMVGVRGNERAFSSIGFSLKARLPWLHINLVTAFAAASVVALFEGIIARITALAIFLPVVAGQGGNAGAQSLAVVMRGLVMREIPRDRIRSLLAKESLVGLLNGLIIGVVTGLVAWIWQGNVFLGVVIALAMVVNLLAAGFSGALIPIVMKAMGLDPAQSSSIILTTVTDIVGFFAFLGFAVLFEGFLV